MYIYMCTACISYHSRLFIEQTGSDDDWVALKGNLNNATVINGIFEYEH